MSRAGRILTRLSWHVWCHGQAASDELEAEGSDEKLQVKTTTSTRHTPHRPLHTRRQARRREQCHHALSSASG